MRLALSRRWAYLMIGQTESVGLASSLEAAELAVLRTRIPRKLCG